MKRYISKHSSMIKLLAVVVGLCSLYVWVYASSGGFTGRTSNASAGCGSCHGSSATSTTMVTVSSSSGSFTVSPGSTTTFMITVSNSSTALHGTGIDIAVKTDANGNPGTNAGTLAATSGDGLYVSNGELTQSSPIDFTSGNMVTISFTWTAPSTAGTYYLRAIANAVNEDGNADGSDKWNWMTPQAITVQSASTASVSITSPNGNESWCAGSQHNITWTSSGVTNVKIDLSSNGGSSYATTLVASTSAASGSWPWSIPSSQATGSQYRVRVSDASNASTMSASAANFSITNSPSITTQPSSQTVSAGANVTFTVAASGGGLSYQWQKNSANISGQTSSSLTLNSVTTSSAGDYDCVVSNGCGDVTTNTATLTVNSGGGGGGGAVLALSVSSYDFGNVRVSSSLSHTISSLLENTGSSTLTITNISISGTNASQFRVTNARLPISIDAGSSRSLTLVFRPTSTGTKNATVNFTTNSSSSSPTLALSGTGTTRRTRNESDESEQEQSSGQRNSGQFHDDNNQALDPGIEDIGNVAIFPNPANDRINISIDLYNAGPVDIRVFDIMGNLVNEFNENYITTGAYSLTWDGRDSHGLLLPNGSYNVVVSTVNNTVVNPLVIYR